ncbi:MAG: peptidyl-tRNA hydrolase [Ilumatobacter sp.]|jgi:peptidyl-tRNA hydrolase
MSTESPRALQLAARVEKVDPPTVAQICAAAALATITLLDDERSQPDGEWYEPVAAWNGDRIRKIVRRGRASAWQRAQEPDGVTVERDGAEVRAFVPGRLDEAPEQLAKLQIQSSDLDAVERVDMLPEAPALVTLMIAVTPLVAMSWGKQAAQCAHAGQWAWMRSDRDLVSEWDRGDRPLTIVHPTKQLWAELVEHAPVQIHDGGFTEIPAGTKTALAWWSSPTDTQARPTP